MAIIYRDSRISQRGLNHNFVLKVKEALCYSRPKIDFKCGKKNTNCYQYTREDPITLPSRPREEAICTGVQLAEFNPCPEDPHQSCNRNRSGLNATNESNVSSENVRFSVQVEEGRNSQQHMSLIDTPSCLITAQIYNAYKLLLLTICNSLLRSDIIKIREWANSKFAVEPNLSPTDIIFQLDRRGAFNAFDLSELRAYFVSIVRFDLVYLIDEFSRGDYAKLKKMILINRRNNSHEQISSKTQQGSSRVHMLPDSAFSRSATDHRGVSNVRQLGQQSALPQNDEISTANSSGRMAPFSLYHPSTSRSNANENKSPTREISETVPDSSATNNTRGNATDVQRMSACGNTPVTKGNMTGMMMVSRSPQNSMKQSIGPSRHRSRDNNVQGSDHRKKEDKWLCGHYKRKCMVKFECCNEYWPCHRCHNERSTCGRRKLKSRDTTMIKCVECGKKQKFGQFCVSCNTQFSSFYCGLCKHLTGYDDHPYHCDKCGICRIHGDRSYHCDVCGICLDVQLRGKHKCRPNSAHDECCICLEDAFTGCQILPCSHKVHKDCATRMIRNGITRCPVCRESFAHKLERRPTAR